MVDQGDGYSGREPEGSKGCKKKIPVRLAVKIAESQEPVVGLNFIVEYIAVSNTEMEPMYECNLCPGYKERKYYLRKKLSSNFLYIIEQHVCPLHITQVSYIG